MQNKFTPGPWEADGESVEASDGKMVADCAIFFPKDDRQTENEANARLIASAPDLLDALTRIMEYAHDGAAIRDVDPNEQPQFVKARAAIAKAEGRS